MNYIPEPVKKRTNERLESLKKSISKLYDAGKNKFKILESNSALKGFTKRYTIDGHEGIDAQSFFDAVETKVTKLLSQNRQTKVNLILTCTMERVNIKTGEVTITNVPFRSKTEIILDASGVKEIYKKAMDKIMELSLIHI